MVVLRTLRRLAGDAPLSVNETRANTVAQFQGHVQHLQSGPVTGLSPSTQARLLQIAIANLASASEEDAPGEDVE